MKKLTVSIMLVSIALGWLSATQTSKKDEEYVLAAVWDEKTIGAKLTTPSGLALDKDGNLYVSGLWTVDKLSPEGKLVKRIDWEEKAKNKGGCLKRWHWIQRATYMYAVGSVRKSGSFLLRAS